MVLCIGMCVQCTRACACASIHSVGVRPQRSIFRHSFDATATATVHGNIEMQPVYTVKENRNQVFEHQFPVRACSHPPRFVLKKKKKKKRL